MLSRRAYRDFVCLDCRLRIIGSITSRRSYSRPSPAHTNKPDRQADDPRPEAFEDTFSRLLIQNRAEASVQELSQEANTSRKTRGIDSFQSQIPISAEKKRSTRSSLLWDAEPRLRDKTTGRDEELSEEYEERGRKHGLVHERRESKHQNGGYRRSFAPKSEAIDPAAGPRTRPKRTYRSHGQLLAAEEENLRVDILGQPAHAIVLRDQGPLKKRPAREINSEAPAAGQISLAELLEKESVDLTPDEVLRNIHDLRPASETVLSSSDYTRLQETLVDGFKRDQLEAYVSRYGAAAETRGAPDPPWVLKNTGWIPASEENEHQNREDTVPNLAMQGYLAPNMKPKERLAIRILRECWGLSRWDVANRQGYLNVTLRETEFALLLLGSKKWLNEIASSLGPGKQIELICVRNLISILAPKVLAEAALDKINDALSRTKTARFAAELVSRDPLDPVILEEVGRITSTLVRLDDSKNQIVVTWVQESDHAEELEDLGDAVLRFLLFSYGPRYRHEARLMIWPVEASETGRPIISSHDQDKMAWESRGRIWARWSSPMGLGDRVLQAQLRSYEMASTETLPHPIVPERLPVRPWNRLVQPFQDWSPFAYTTTTATFGHILQEQTAPPRAKPPRVFDKTPERIFVPIVPPLANLENLELANSNRQPETGSLPLPAPSAHQSILVLRFLPAPDQAAQTRDTTAAAPTLEVRLEVTSTNEVGALLGVRAIMDSHVCDVLLPGAPVDVRVLQTRFFELPAPAVDADHPCSPLLAFLAAAELHPADGELRTPARLRGMRIPARLLAPFRETCAPAWEQGQRVGVDATEAGLDEASARVEELVEIDYLFAALEMQRFATANWEDFSLVYTSVEAGQRGGRRAELALDAQPADDSAMQKWDATTHGASAFMAAVTKLVVGKGRERWQGQIP